MVICWMTDLTWARIDPLTSNGFVARVSNVKNPDWSTPSDRSASVPHCVDDCKAVELVTDAAVGAGVATDEDSFTPLDVVVITVSVAEPFSSLRTPPQPQITAVSATTTTIFIRIFAMRAILCHFLSSTADRTFERKRA